MSPHSWQAAPSASVGRSRFRPLLPGRWGRDVNRFCVIGGTSAIVLSSTLAWQGGIPIVAIIGMLGAALLVVSSVFTASRLRRKAMRAEFSSILAERAKVELLTNMNHELRTPLNAIIGFSQIIHSEMMGPIGTTAYLEQARIIEEAGQRLLLTINDILDIAAVDAGGKGFSEDVLDIGELMDGLLLITHGRAEAAKVTLFKHAPSDLPLLRADGAYIKQLLLCLIDNGIKYTPSGGRVTINGVIARDGGMAVTIEDTGIGIAATDLERITHAFAIGEDVFSRRYQGQGLGLTIARRLTELHGGTLLLESQQEKGTRVTVKFPTERVVENASAGCARNE